MSGVREVYAMSPSQMPEWKAVCKAFAEKVEAELLFVNEQSCGVQYKDGTFGHIYIDEMEAFFRENGQKGDKIMGFEERAEKVIAGLTEDDINALKDTQNIKNHIDRLEEVVERIFGFDYSDSKNYDKLKETFPDIEDISQKTGNVWSRDGLDIEIPQITDDGHTVKLWLGLCAEPQLLDDITLQFSLETVYDYTSEPWHIVTRCVPIPTDKEREMRTFDKDDVKTEQNKTVGKGEAK